MAGVQKHYAKYVTSGGDGPTVLQGRASELGYSQDFLPLDLRHEKLFQASCGSGCPLRILPAGRITPSDQLIIDLGSGAGHDVILASRLMKKLLDDHDNNHDNITKKKKVIGIDFTQEMVDAAKENLQQYPDLSHMVEFVQSDLEHPDADFLAHYENQADLIISNGVLNLCQNKLLAFQTAYKLLRPGGRLVFSDVMKLE